MKNKVKFLLILIVLLFTLVPFSNEKRLIMEVKGQSSSITINDNSDFVNVATLANPNDQGGTVTNPWLIDSKTFTKISAGSLGIRIEDTTEHFVIQNCVFEGDGGMLAIDIDNVAEGTATIINNNFNEVGGLYGMVVEATNQLIFQNNEITTTTGGFMWITGRSNFSDISNNRFIGGGNVAVAISIGNFNVVSENLFQEHGTAAVSIEGNSNFNVISDNTFVHSDSSKTLARDDSNGFIPNYWLRNYYSNYGGSGNYPISGTANAVDNNPSLTETVPIQTGPISSGTTVGNEFLLLPVLALITLIRLKKYHKRAN